MGSPAPEISPQRRQSVYDRLRVKPVINACGIYTDLGGSILSDEIWADLTELNSAYIDIVDLLNATGETIAGLVGSEAARVTPGVSAGITLATAAAMAGPHGPNWEQLPDTTGMPNQIILQRRQTDQYKYLNPARLSGAEIIIAGDEDGTSLEDIHKLVSKKTAAILIPAHLDTLDNIVTMKELKSFTQEHSVKLLVDAAYQVFPTDEMKKFAALGADLTMFSSKYYFGPNAGGFLSGSQEMIDVVAGLDFTQYESGKYRTFGRPFKMGRYEIAAVCLALQNWFECDHDARWQGYAQKADTLVRAINEVDGLTARPVCFTFDETIEPSPVNAAMIEVKHPTTTASELIRGLETGSPAIYTVPFDGSILVVTETLRDGDEVIVSNRLKELLNEAR